MENLPPTPEVEEVVQPSPSAAALPPVAPPVAAERKSRSNQVTPRDLPPVPKVRSLSLSRTDNSLQIKAVDDRQVASTVAPPAAVSKLSRSKSSVEKKIQHEVAFFWRRHNLRKESSDTSASTGRLSVPSGSSTDVSAAGGATGRQRKDLRKIKRDKEEKRKRSNAEGDAPSPSQPFLSRLFGSRRSNRKKNKNGANDCTEMAAPDPVATVAKSSSSQSVPSLKSVHDDKGYESLVLAAETVAPPAADVEDSDDPWIQPTLNPTYYVDRSRKTSQGS